MEECTHQWPLVEVTWNDAASDSDWAAHDPEEVSDFWPIKTYGLLLFDTPERVVIAQNFSLATGQVSCRMTIPRGMVVAIRQLEYPSEHPEKEWCDVDVD